jgi:primase-polymerase (primpol)-like protein
MAYMRGNPYVYESNDGLELYSDGKLVTFPPDLFDALAIMRVCELLDEPERFAAVWAITEEHAGNFGADAVRKLSGGQTAFDMLKRMITSTAPERANEYEVCGTCGTFLRVKGFGGDGTSSR